MRLASSPALRRHARAVITLLQLLGIACLAVAPPARAQEMATSQFVPLRPDGNGVAWLRRPLGVVVDTTTVARALQAVARQAGLNLTFDPYLSGLDAPAPRPSISGRVAEALLVILSATRLEARVSASGELVLAPLPASRDFTGGIRGQVVDSAASPIAGAIVSLAALRSSAATDAGGRFTFERLPAGRVTLRVHAFGYVDQQQTAIVPAGGTADLVFRLTAAPARLTPVRTESRTARQITFEDRPSVSTTTMGARDVRGVPSAVEADVMRTVQLLPGVSARNDYSSTLNVRGGESEQNLILLDGYPIFNPFHLAGLFSTFIPAAIGEVTLLSGGFPASYGNRLSSVLDVRSSEEKRDGMHGTADVSLLSASATVRGTFGRSGGSWMLAGRRTYADKFVNAFNPDALPYHFRDVQGHLTYRLPGSVTLATTLYAGEDVVIASTSPDHLTFGNRVLGATLTKSIGDPTAPGGRRLELTQRVSSSRFHTAVLAPDEGFTLGATADELRLAGTVTAPGTSHDRTLGYELAAQRFDYATNTTVVLLPVDSFRQRATRASVFYDDLWRVRPSLLVQAGVRADLPVSGQRALISPRLSAKYFLSPDLALTAAVGRYTQSVHSLGREDVPLRLADFWTTSDSLLPFSTAMHYIAGLERRVGTSRTLRVEGFLKAYDNLLEPNPASDARVAGDEFLPTTGRSYGVDVLLQQFGAGRFSGWLAYTFAVSTRRQADGVEYHPGQDRRHDLNLVGSWRGSAWTVGTRFGLATGTPYTAAIGEFDRREYDPVMGTLDGRSGAESRVYLMGARNAERLPISHRLDLSLTRNGRLRGLAVSPYLSIVNAYNARNAFAYFYDYRRSPPTRSSAPQFPTLPSVGVDVVW